MSNLKNETIADIVADIRAQNQGLPEDGYALSPLAGDLLSIADRIEAAAKRERESGAEAAQVCGEIGEMIGREAARRSDERTAEKSSSVGNAAAMREALLEASIALSDATHHHMTEDDAKECLSVVNASLSAPLRNCDVGTAEEQNNRFLKFCESLDCERYCPLFKAESCELAWAQMPYDEGGAK